jgi:hypothetical protein
VENDEAGGMATFRNVIEQEVFHRKFATSLWPPGEKERKRDTPVLGDFGLAGVSHGITVHFQPL